MRVDRSIDFSSLAELGALPYPSVAVWSGSIVIAREGEYAFSISADDTDGSASMAAMSSPMSVS